MSKKKGPTPKKKVVFHSGLWERDEAFKYLNERFFLDELPRVEREQMIDKLCAMTHRPWCRTHLADSMPEYGSECTCDSAEKLGTVESASTTE